MEKKMDKSFDMNGRPYARFGEVKEGTILIADGGFNETSSSGTSQ